MKTVLFIPTLFLLLYFSYTTSAAFPDTLVKAVDVIIESLSDEDKLKIKTTEKVDLIKFHHGLGTGIRNQLGFWQGNKVLFNDVCGKPCHPDDASGVIIFALWCKLNNIEYSRESYRENLENTFQQNLKG